MAKKKKIYNADTGQWETESSSAKTVTSQPSRGYDANTSSFYDIAPVKTTTTNQTTKKKKNEGLDWFNSLEDGYDFGDVTKTILGTVGFGERSKDIAPVKVDTSAIEQEYSGYKREDLLKERDKLKDQLLNYSKADSSGYSLGGILSDISGQTAKKLKQNEEYQTLNEKYNKVMEMLEDDYVSNNTYEDGLKGFADKTTDTITGNLMTGMKGIESTTKKILGQEADTDLTLYEKLSNSARQDSKGAEGVYLDVVGSIARMTPQLMLGGVAGTGAATVLGFANYGGGAYNQAKREGYSEEQSLKYGATIGTMEMVTEKVLGGLSSVYGKTAASKATSKVIDKLIPKLISNKVIREVLNSAIAEGTEEFLQEYLENIARDTILDEKGLLKSSWGNITNTDVLADALYSGFVGGLTGGIMKVQPAIDVARYEKATGRNAETGLTTNEQTVVDKVIENKTTEIQKQQAIEKEANRIIENQSKLYGDLTESEKNSIRKQVTERMDNGEIDFSNEKVSKKELNKITEQARNDLEKGYIGTDVIENTLGKDTDLTIDNYLRKSYDEKAKRSQQFKYEATESDSDIKKNLAATTDVLNDTERSHELFDTVTKIAEYTNTQYAFINNEKLSSLGYDAEGKTINGLVRTNQDGTSRVLINVDSEKALNSIVGHETTHLLEGTNEYNALKEAIKNYATTKGEYDTRLATLKEIYKGVENTNIENEVTSDLVGDYIFTEEKFVNELASTQPSVFEKVYNYIKHIYDLATAGSKEQRELEKAKYLFEKAYNEVNKTTTQESNSNSTTEASSNTKGTVKYSLTDGKIQGLENYTVDEIKSISRDYIIEKLHESDLYDVDVKGIEIHGSRGRGTAKTNSDLDVVFEYSGDIKEDTLFNILNEENLEIDGIKVDLNPINEYDTGTLEDYMKRSNEYDKEVLEKSRVKTDNKGRELSEAQQKFFMDSKVRDENGNLKVLYNGSGNHTEYLPGYMSDDSIWGKGIYLTPYKDIASMYGNDVKETYVNITKPIEVGKHLTFEQYNELYKAINEGESGYREEFDMYNDDLDLLWDMTNKGSWADYADEIKKYTGYDGIIVNADTEADTMVIAFQSNQVKNVDNTNPTSNSDIRYSLTDNQGRTLSKQQQEYFKDSKIRDENGNLEVMYRGDDGETINVFDKTKSKKSNLYGTGFYFSDENMASLYGNTTPYYLDVKNPLYVNKDTHNITKEQYAKFIKLASTNEDYSFENYGNISTDELIDKLYDGRSDFKLINDVVATAMGDYRDAFNVFEEANGIKYDGIISNSQTVVFESNQIKNVDNTSPTTNEDIRYSLSNQGEDIAPTGDYNIYGKDVRYTDPSTIPITEEDYNSLAPVNGYTEGDANLSNENNFASIEENIAPIQEQITELNNKLDDIFENIMLEKYTSEDFERIGEEANQEQFTLSYADEINTKTKPEILKDMRDTFGINNNEARALYNNLSKYDNINDIVKELESYREIKYKIQDNSITDIKKFIRGTRLDISNIKKQLTDFGKSERMSLMGKGLILGNSGQQIDSFYQELSGMFPSAFSSDINTEVDQLNAISDFLYKDNDLIYEYSMSDEELYSLANDFMSDINNTETFRASRENNNMFDRNNRESIFANEPYASNTEVDEDIAPFEQVLDSANLRSLEENAPERIVDTRNNLPTANEVLDLYLQEQYDRINEKNRQKQQENNAPKVEKSKLRQFTDTLSNLLVNRNVEIDNLAKESGNNNIKYAGDMLNSVAGEVGGDIYTAQTDNEGHAIGKSLSSLFTEVKENGTYDAFNDYLEQYSNIDRHKQGKGSTTPLKISQNLVSQYEAAHPEFKALAEDVWQYGRNIKNNMVDSGLITQQFSDTLSEMYPHYVPYMENREMSNFYPDLKEAKPVGVIKRAKGGASDILAIEDALIKYTYAYKKATRQNQLYQEIVNTLSEKADIGADVRSDPTELSESLYQDESGNYLTAYIDGERESVKISEDLYKGLKKDLEHQVRDLEQKLSLVTTPLQKVSEVRRNLLTTWSPTFIITNPIKDIQDAVFNSKHTTSMLKNYPTSFYELSNGGRTETAKQFLTLYGSGMTMGDYTAESGLSNGEVVQKNAKFLKGLSNLNEIVELAPRYAEFKASLEHGASVQEAMYNAREVTTNFNRGGVITKALNRNGATFLNASVQGFDKFVRNFSGENGAKGVASSLGKVALFGILPAVFNELVLGNDDDEEYKAIPDYIKDNYYLIKTGDGSFIRIPKGRMLSVFGSAARRTLEYFNGEEDAFEGFLKNASSQVGVNDPTESNIFTPFLQAFGSENGEAWYGGDLVPTRLQDKAAKEQYDSSTDAMSIWLGDKLNISPYKINYVIDQYSGGIGDMILPLITEEAQSESDSALGMALAPLRDKFTADSTNDNKYAGDIYTLSDKLKKATSEEKETDDYKIKQSYLYSVTSEMGKLYQERREVQADNSLSKSEKYKKVQNIQNQINQLAKEGLDNYENINKTDNYAIVGGKDYYKYESDGETKWSKVKDEELNDINSLGMSLNEKSSYFSAKNKISSIKDSYKDSDDYTGQKRDIIDTVKAANLTDEQKEYLYDKYYGNTETLAVVDKIGLNFNTYLDYEWQNFEADKDENGKTISGSKKAKVFNYINNMNATFEQKVILAKLEYNSYDEYNYEIIDYLNNNNNVSYSDMVSILKKLGFEVDDNGNIRW